MPQTMPSICKSYKGSKLIWIFSLLPDVACLSLPIFEKLVTFLEKHRHDPTVEIKVLSPYIYPFSWESLTWVDEPRQHGKRV